MNINLSKPVTTDGTLKLTQAEYDYLNSFLAAHDRGGYYLALYNMTGSQEALLQAQITTFSEGAGGAAYAANVYLKENYSERYTETIYGISQLVAESSLTAIEKQINDNPNNIHTGTISDVEELTSARDAWDKLRMGDLFPGNSLLAQNDVKAFLASKAVQVQRNNWGQVQIKSNKPAALSGCFTKSLSCSSLLFCEDNRGR